MDSLDSVNVGDTVTVIAKKEDGFLFIPDGKRNDISKYSERWISTVWATRTRDGNRVILIQHPNDMGGYFSGYAGLYTRDPSSIVHPDIDKSKEKRYYEIYAPGNVVEHIRSGNTKTKDTAGMTCHECRGGYPYAEANFNDKLVCWSCRDSLRWKYKMIDGKVVLL